MIVFVVLDYFEDTDGTDCPAVFKNKEDALKFAGQCEEDHGHEFEVFETELQE